MPRRQLGPEARGRPAGTGPSERLSALSPRMADPRVAAAPPAQLPDRHARGALRLRVGRVCRSRAVPDVARARYDGRDARRSPVARILLGLMSEFGDAMSDHLDAYIDSAAQALGI